MAIEPFKMLHSRPLMKGVEGSVNDAVIRMAGVPKDHTSQCISVVILHLILCSFQGHMPSFPLRVSSAQLSALTAKAASHDTMYKLCKGEVLISAEFLSRAEENEQSGESQAVSREDSNLRTNMLLWTIFRLGRR